MMRSLASYFRMAVILTRSGRICGCFPVTDNSCWIGYDPSDAARRKLFHLHHGESQPHARTSASLGKLLKRVFEHKWKEHEGFTAKYNCDRLVWCEAHQNITKAIAREEELKGWRRGKKIALIESTNAAWIDLSRDWYDCEPADYRRALDRVDE